MLSQSRQNFSIQRSIVLFSYLSHLFQQMNRKPDSKRLLIVFHSYILSLYCNYVNGHGYHPHLCPKCVTSIHSSGEKQACWTDQGRDCGGGCSVLARCQCVNHF